MSNAFAKQSKFDVRKNTEEKGIFQARTFFSNHYFYNAKLNIKSSETLNQILSVCPRINTLNHSIYNLRFNSLEILDRSFNQQVLNIYTQNDSENSWIRKTSQPQLLHPNNSLEKLNNLEMASTKLKSPLNESGKAPSFDTMNFFQNEESLGSLSPETNFFKLFVPHQNKKLIGYKKFASFRIITPERSRKEYLKSGIKRAATPTNKPWYQE